MRVRNALVVICALAAVACAASEAREPVGDPGVIAPMVLLAAPGRVEGAGEPVELGAGLEGVIHRVFVTAGMQVRRGEILAELHRDDLGQETLAAAAELQRMEAERQRLQRGGRDEARRRADAEREYAEAILTEAQLRFARYDGLFREGVVPATMRDEAERDLRAAEARVRVARETQLLADETPLAEDLLKANAEVEHARARLSAAKSRHEQRFVRAPFDGVVLRVNKREGETYSVLAGGPLVTLADVSRYFVRAEVDERDTTRVHLGQPATVSADDGVVVAGRVTWKAPVMGKPDTRTGDPADKHHRDVLEVLVELSRPSPWPLDQRVTTKFLK